MKRREFIQAILASGGLAVAPELFAAKNPRILTKAIPSTGEALPVIGMGSFVNFNFPEDTDTIKQRTQMLNNFFALGGKMIDSSPMYGAAEKNLGLCTQSSEAKKSLFSATKVWTSSVDNGIKEIETSRKLWQVEQFDLLQVHNLVS